VAVTRNSNSVLGAERFDVYVLGIISGNFLDIFSSTQNSWGLNARIQFPVVRTNCFLARFESIYTGTVESGIVIKELLAIEGDFVFPMGLDTLSPESFVSSTIQNATRCSFAVAAFRSGNVLTVKHTNSFTTNGNVTTIQVSSLDQIGIHQIPIGQYSVSVFRLGGQDGNYLNGAGGRNHSFFINTNFTDIDSFEILNPGNPRTREGTLRMGHDTDINARTVYFTIPVNSGTITYRTPQDTSGKTLVQSLSHPGSIIIKASSDLSFSNIDFFVTLERNTAPGSLCITRSIDVDKGPSGNGVNESVYVAGSFRGGGYTYRKYTIVNETATLSLTRTSNKAPSDMAAFLIKISPIGQPLWATMIDGDNMDEGISVAVQRDVFPEDELGRYNVYLSGTFKGDGDVPYNVGIFNSTNSTLPAQSLNTEPIPAIRIFQSEIGVVGGHEESFIVKFNSDGKYIFNYKASGTADVSIKYIDVGPGDNVAMCGLMNTPLLRLQEPDGSISRYIPMEKYERGFVVKFRTAGMLILPSPSPPNDVNTYKKTIINTTGFPLYIAIYKLAASFMNIPSVSVVPPRKTMDFVYDSETWVAEASDKLTTDLLYLDRDNGRFGFGTTFPRATVDVRGDMEISGSATIGRDLRVNGSLNIRDNIEVGSTSSNGSLNIVYDYNGPFPIRINDEPILKPGMIIMWSGDPNSVPQGWKLCDGLDGTPDLRGRFVLGYSGFSGGVSINGTNAITGSQSGVNEANPLGLDYSIAPYEVGDVSGEALHMLTLAEMPIHNHGIPYRNHTFDTGTDLANNKFGNSGPPLSGTDVTTAVGSNIPHNNMPPYYVLAFIIKE
jgi:microcystin-dependent protein